MAFVNNYKAPTIEPIVSIPEGEYDVNFCAPLPPSGSLESDKVRLVPFIPSLHAAAFHKAYSQHSDEIEKYLPISWKSLPELLTGFEYMIRRDPSSIVFAIIDRTKPNDGGNVEESIAGIIGYLNTSTRNLSTEIGPVVVLPSWQRTFVSSHAIGLMLNYALNLPSEGGLGYRRVAWTANPFNNASVRAAERMGFKIEGIQRWTWVLPLGRDGGKPPVDGKRGAGQGRDSTVLSVCWDDWENGTREQVARMMNRQ
ncbi:hypothetical protein CC1G_07080 [Coprinopsis cinerea okayama7|uniref:N-acetyltransferase domain-containing protein n=1 Tax=Coprinopsis cinerea (strain Okayama-7 / 130 / ATCC MYA-4618 / FGSC 9003) TaxID=240176 RepID=A8NUD9_COPC7|nr:hypothetical protein CC1G_07080 [Coprinopsis cinerea okayama7\|eukprot:XP_001836433.1 hypothetical protein CC1G_07080 [Coprinopsis cinerea okayama7\